MVEVFSHIYRRAFGDGVTILATILRRVLEPSRVVCWRVLPHVFLARRRTSGDCGKSSPYYSLYCEVLQRLMHNSVILDGPRFVCIYVVWKWMTLDHHGGETIDNDN
jgi:hypothetical protein